MSVKKFGIGQPIRRVEDFRLLTGGGNYLDDYAPDKCLHAVVLRSPYAHASFTFTDLDTARGMKGVKLILTAAEVAHLGDVPCQAAMPNFDGTKSHVADIPVLARGVVKHVGDAVAFVVAESVAQARDAAEAIGVEYEILPAVADRAQRDRPGAPAVWSERGRQRRL